MHPHLSCGLSPTTHCTHCISLSAEYLPRASARSDGSQKKYTLDRHLQPGGGGGMPVGHVLDTHLRQQHPAAGCCGRSTWLDQGMLNTAEHQGTQGRLVDEGVSSCSHRTAGQLLTAYPGLPCSLPSPPTWAGCPPRRQPPAPRPASTAGGRSHSRCQLEPDRPAAC
jgi:hypothetical protein